MYLLKSSATFTGFVAATTALLLIGCGNESPPGDKDVSGTDTVELRDTPVQPRDATADDIQATDVSDVEVLYPNNLCERDDECSTDYCYGVATPQGHFEPPRCQVGCLQLNDFRRYCDSDRDCCSGRCCLDCGAKEGLCVLALPPGTSD